MRDALGISSGLLALLFAAGAFSLLLSAPPEPQAALEAPSAVAVEAADLPVSPFVDRTDVVPVSATLAPLLP